jgi:hypothetical protein
LPSSGDWSSSWTNGNSNSHSAPQSQDSALPSSSSSSPPIPSHLPQPYSAFQFPHSTSSSSSTVMFASNGSSSALGPSSSDHSLPVLHHSSHPAHVRLNLRIQSFIESFRQLAPSSPSSPSSSMGSLTSSMHNGGPSAAVPGGAGTAAGGGVTLTHALTAAQGLHAEAKKLGPEDRAVYLQEIKDVGALFAYTDPETSILKGFLEQGRRIVLAEQVNRAILRESNSGPSCIVSCEHPRPSSSGSESHCIALCNVASITTVSPIIGPHLPCHCNEAALSALRPHSPRGASAWTSADGCSDVSPQAPKASTLNPSSSTSPAASQPSGP